MLVHKVVPGARGRQTFYRPGGHDAVGGRQLVKILLSGLDFGLGGKALTTGLPPIPTLQPYVRGLVPETGGFQAPSRLAGNVCYAKNHASCGEEGIPPEELQEFLWQRFFADPRQWWDNRRSKTSRQHPDLRHKKSKAALWLNNRYKPLWVDSRLDKWDAEKKMPAESVSTTIQEQIAGGMFRAEEGHLDVRTCRKLCEDGRITDVVDALDQLVQRGCFVNKTLFYRVLKRCIAHKDLVSGRRVHALTVGSGYEGDSFLATHLMGLYASNGRLDEANRVFTKVSPPDAYNWATIIFAYARHGEAAEAIRLYRQMCESTNIVPTDHIYVAVLKACATAKDLIAGKEIHAHILSSPRKPAIFVQTGLVSMYANCGSLDDARKLFDRLSERDVVTWNALLGGYAQQGMGNETLSLYSRMQEERIPAPNSVTFICLLQACASGGVAALHQGKQIHAQIKELGLQDDLVLGTSLVNMYAKCGSLEDARSMFDVLPVKNVVTWNSMISGYAQHELGQEALTLYSGMQEEGLAPNSVTFLCLLQACASVGVGALTQGKQFHAQIEEMKLQSDLVLGGSLVTMYAKCSSIEDARTMFDSLPNRNVVTWNAMFAAYAQQGMDQEAFSLYSSMQTEGIITPNSVTFLCLLQACAKVGAAALSLGKQLQVQIEERELQNNVVVGNSLVNMYAKCGSLDDARNVFDRLPDKNVVTWTALIAGYAQQGMGQEALDLHSCMQREGITTPNAVTFVCLLQACTIAAALPLGKQLHEQIEEQGLQAHPAVGAALVNMYAKCGSMSDSQRVFDMLPERTIEAWNALTGGYTCQGESETVFDSVHKMRLEGMQPDVITFLHVLTVCSHVGLVDKGRKYFEVMGTEYGVTPTVEHYTCMMGLLGRAGHLHEALQLAKTMPFAPDGAVWLTLLGACRKWNNIEIGQQAFEFAVSVDGMDAASYVSMSNIYASAEMWEAAREMQARRVKLGAWKEPGQSWWTDMGGVVHTFVVGEKKHPESEVPGTDRSQTEGYAQPVQ